MTETMQMTPTPRRNDDAIQAAALQAFGEWGFNGASMRTIAQSAGTSLSNLYNYYPSKQALLFTILTNSNDELLERLRNAVEKPNLGPVDKLAAAVRAHVGFVIDHQQLSLVALSEVRYLTGQYRVDIVRGRDEADRIFRDIIGEGAASGAFRTPYPDDAARAILSMTSAISTWFRRDGRLTGAQVAEAHSRYALGLVESV
jgi:AcrR family transcriptional regulator